MCSINLGSTWVRGGGVELGTESCMQGEYTQVRLILNETQPMDHRSGLVTSQGIQWDPG